MDRADIYRARWVVPMTSATANDGSDVIDGGWLRVRDHHIVEIGHGTPGEPHHDLGDVAILPGLANAHTHLEFADLTAPIGKPGMALPDWIAAVIAHRRRPNAVAEDKLYAVLAGLAKSWRSGIGWLGEIATKPWLEPQHWGVLSRTPKAMDLTLFSEVLGLSDEAQAAALDWAAVQGRLWASDANAEGVTPAISPHAPYSTPMPLVEAAVSWAKLQHAPVAMHLAESLEEMELLRDGRGPFRGMLEGLSLWRPEYFPVTGGCRAYLERLAKAPSALIVHGNYLERDDWQYLAQQPHMHVVYCPRTHAFFQHAEYPLAEMLKAGVRVVLGTDSCASNPDLSIWSEVRHVAEHHADVDPWDLLAMVTRRGATALGHDGAASLRPGQPARFVSVPVQSTSPSELATALMVAPAVTPHWSPALQH